MIWPACAEKHASANSGIAGDLVEGSMASGWRFRGNSPMGWGHSRIYPDLNTP